MANDKNSQPRPVAPREEKGGQIKPLEETRSYGPREPPPPPKSTNPKKG